VGSAGGESKDRFILIPFIAFEGTCLPLCTSISSDQSFGDCNKTPKVETVRRSTYNNKCTSLPFVTCQRRSAAICICSTVSNTYRQTKCPVRNVQTVTNSIDSRQTRTQSGGFCFPNSSGIFFGYVCVCECVCVCLVCMCVCVCACVCVWGHCFLWFQF
jgi:hypothetical protein